MVVDGIIHFFFVKGSLFFHEGIVMREVGGEAKKNKTRRWEIETKKTRTKRRLPSRSTGAETGKLE